MAFTPLAPRSPARVLGLALGLLGASHAAACGSTSAPDAPASSNPGPRPTPSGTSTAPPTGNFGGAGDVSKDLVDDAFVVDTTACPWRGGAA